MKTILLWLAVCVSLVILVGCHDMLEVEDCPREDMYISHYEPITFPDGRTIDNAVYVCP